MRELQGSLEQVSRLNKELENMTSLKDSLREILDLAREENKAIRQKTNFPSKGVQVSTLQAELAKEKKVNRECCERAKEIMERLNDQYPAAAPPRTGWQSQL